MNDRTCSTRLAFSAIGQLPETCTFCFVAAITHPQIRLGLQRIKDSSFCLSILIEPIVAPVRGAFNYFDSKKGRMKSITMNNNNGADCNGKECTSDAIGEAPRRSWPEEPDPTKFWIYQVYERWTYSYMSPLLKKGAKQTLDDGTHLSSEDLHAIPESMQSSNLSKRFWYVGWADASCLWHF